MFEASVRALISGMRSSHSNPSPESWPWWCCWASCAGGAGVSLGMSFMPHFGTSRSLPVTSGCIGHT